MTVFVLTEECEVVGVFSTEAEAALTAKTMELYNWDIQSFVLKS